MSAGEPQFPEYGEGGDFIGARRMRRAFRWCAAFCVLFTCSLWFSERFLRYDHADRQYLSALTLYPEQGRNLLRQAVRHDAAVSETPSSLYLEALAEREEDDLILPTYERAYTLDPDNVSLGIRYGARLFHEGRAADARVRFRVAGTNAPGNLLPAYLEAAVLPWLDESGENFDAAFSLISHVNNSEGAVTYPRPLWFGALPRTGYWYSQLRRESVQACSEPLYRFADAVLSRARRDIDERRTEGWSERLTAIETMGRRVARNAMDIDSQASAFAGGGLPQAYIGLFLADRAREQLVRIERMETGSAGEPDKTLVQYADALREMRDFENVRDVVIYDEQRKYRFPLLLTWQIIGVLAATYSIVYIACKVTSVSSVSHNVPHSRQGRFAFSIWFFLYLALLATISVLQRSSSGALPMQDGIQFGGWTMLLACLGFGLIYALTALPAVDRVMHRRNVEGVPQESIKHGVRAYRRAYLSLARRYLGIQFGLALWAICLWTVWFRVLVGVYPWDIELLATGLGREEIELVKSVLTQVGL